MDRFVVVGPASQALGIKVAAELGVPTVSTEFKTFPDGEDYLRLAVDKEEDLKGGEAIVVQSCGPGRGIGSSQNSRLFQLFMMVDALKRIGAGAVRAVVPYLAYGRQDKVFRPGETKFAELLLRLLEGAGVTEVLTVDQHAPKIFEVLSIPARNLDPMPALADYCRKLDLVNPVVVSPDKGAVERSKAFAGHIGPDTPVEVFSKERDVVTGEIKMTGSLDVGGSDVIVADDIISTGGTMASAIRIAKKSGALRVFAVCTHPLLIMGAVTNLVGAGADGIVATDSIDSQFSVVSLAQTIAGALED
ncbi:MAG: ribose-phosphate diphosphokinase [Promethearchaeota archaeon]